MKIRIIVIVVIIICLILGALFLVPMLGLGATKMNATMTLSFEDEAGNMVTPSPSPVYKFIDPDSGVTLLAMHIGVNWDVVGTDLDPSTFAVTLNLEIKDFDQDTERESSRYTDSYTSSDYPANKLFSLTLESFLGSGWDEPVMWVFHVYMRLSGSIEDTSGHILSDSLTLDRWCAISWQPDEVNTVGTFQLVAVWVA